MQAAVLGVGRWGSYLAWYLQELGMEVCLWGRPGSARLAKWRLTRDNGILRLPEAVRLTDSLEEAIREAELIIVSIDAQQLPDLTAKLDGLPMAGKTVLLCMKGLLAPDGTRLSEAAAARLPAGTPIAVWVGPGHVQDFLDGIPNCMVIDSACERTKKRLATLLSSDLIRIYYGNDLIGNEIGAAAKNVMGIAAGMLDGLHRTSLKGALMARGAQEIARLIEAMGGRAMSAYGLAHLGDYEATLFSPYSHNRRYGMSLVQGVPYDELAEGVKTVLALVTLGERYGVDLPICRGVHRVVHEGGDILEEINALFLRSLKQEFMTQNAEEQ